MMFGPHDSDSVHSQKSTKWKIKRESNDELRQRFVDQTVEQAEHISLVIPDEALSWNEERGHYDFGEIDWSEFKRVLNGEGPCNLSRLNARREAHEKGSWVREALKAYAEKLDREKNSKRRVKSEFK